MAKRWLPNFIFEYVDSGSEDEVTLHANRNAFQKWRFVPNALTNSEVRNLSAMVLGSTNASPLIVAPTGYNGMQRNNADIDLALAASEMGIPFTLSTVANCTVENIRRAIPSGRLWMQLYMMRDRAITENLLKRAKAAGCDTLMFTIDAVHYGNREWDRRCYRDAMKLNFRNQLDTLKHPAWLWNVMVPNGVPKFANIAEYMPAGETGAANGAIFVAKQMEPILTWETAAWLRDRWQGKLVIKGILNTRDAGKAVAIGADGIVVTNHGGRQLDCSITSMDALAEIAPEFSGKLSIIVDSGFRRGTDVVKALCLGANAVMLGRPVLYGVAAGGAVGAKRALSIITVEIDRTLAQLGCQSIADLGPHHLQAV